ncbi:uncharacterized protein [Medicago truncatula]|uniref:uncharacterized protein n=1 Tax=Medicago truncatula TaxID=3880 RepID=UPI0019689192|nr:uncharacterized protein LOC120580926 [Medicago truncatula]
MDALMVEREVDKCLKCKSETSLCHFKGLKMYKLLYNMMVRDEEVEVAESFTSVVLVLFQRELLSVIDTFGNKNRVKPVRVGSMLDSVLKEPTTREERASQFKSPNTDSLLLSLDSGRRLSPPLENDVIVVVPSTSTLVTGLPGLDSTLPHCALHQPITTYHTSLTSDKLPVLEPVHAANVCSSEAQRSVDILQKFWGIILMESMILALSVWQQPRTKRKKSRKIDKFHRRAQVVSTYKLVLKRV